MTDESHPQEPAPQQPAPEPEAPASPDLAAELDDAVAKFDARQVERARDVIQANQAQAPFQLSDVDWRAWVGGGTVIVLLGVSLGGAPWHDQFWVMLLILLFVAAPFIAGAIFLWQRLR